MREVRYVNTMVYNGPGYPSLGAVSLTVDEAGVPPNHMSMSRQITVPFLWYFPLHSLVWHILNKYWFNGIKRRLSPSTSYPFLVSNIKNQCLLHLLSRMLSSTLPLKCKREKETLSHCLDARHQLVGKNVNEHMSALVLCWHLWGQGRSKKVGTVTV